MRSTRRGQAKPQARSGQASSSVRPSLKLGQVRFPALHVSVNGIQAFSDSLQVSIRAVSQPCFFNLAVWSWVGFPLTFNKQLAGGHNVNRIMYDTVDTDIP